MSSWSCPHDRDGVCQRVRGARCDPGMKGCVLSGRFVFAQDLGRDSPRKPVKATEPEPARPGAPKKG